MAVEELGFGSGSGLNQTMQLNPTLNQVPGKLFNAQPLTNTGFSKHKIKLKVMLYHNGESYDLTPYILQVKTHMALGEAAGRFTLLLSFQKRWDSLVFPMDYVEISFSRFLDDPPVMMRGFVGNVRRTRMADSSGKLHRAITINGENFGKIWNNYYIEYLVQAIGQQLQGLDVNASIANPKLLANMLTENYGIASSTPLTGSIANIDFISGLVDKMLNPYIQVLQQVNPQIPTLGYAMSIRSNFQLVNGPLIQSVDSQTVYDVINQYGNRPWCEYFIDDFSNGPILFYRNTPFKAETGLLVDELSNPQTNNTLAGYWMHPEIDDTHVIEEDVGASDNEVYSYFFTYPAIAMYAQTDPRAAILGMQALTADQEADTQNIYNPHVDLENFYRFGFKPIMIASNSIPLETVKISQSSIDQSQEMNQWLVKSFVWSHKMKNGTLRVKGNEHLRIGRYVTQKSTQEEFYIESVDHDITITQPGSLGNDQVYGFTTTIGVTRGRDTSKD